MQKKFHRIRLGSKHTSDLEVHTEEEYFQKNLTRRQDLLVGHLAFQHVVVFLVFVAFVHHFYCYSHSLNT